MKQVIEFYDNIEHTDKGNDKLSTDVHIDGASARRRNTWHIQRPNNKSCFC